MDQEREWPYTVPTQKKSAGAKARRNLAKCLKRIGSPTRARTWDLRINSPSLYQLSYRGSGLRKQNYSLGVCRSCLCAGVSRPQSAEVQGLFAGVYVTCPPI